MNYVLNYNKQSHLIEQLHKTVPIETTFHHGILKNIPNLVKTQYYVEPSTRTNSSNTSYVFQLPDEGFLLGLVLETQLTSEGNNIEAEERIGARVYQNIQFKQGNKILAENCPDYIEARIDESLESQDAFNEMTDPDQDWNANTITTYTPLFYSFTDKPSNALLLNYYRNLEIEAVKNEELDNTLDSPVTALTNRLVCFISYLDDSYYNSYVYNVFYQEYFNIFSYDKYVQKDSVSSGATSLRVSLQCYNLVFAIHLILKNTENYSQEQVKTLKVWCNSGRQIVDTTKRLNYYDTGRQTGKISSHQGNLMFSYFFGISKDRDYHSGGINTVASRDLELEVTFDAVPDENYQLVTVCEYYTLLQTDRMGKLSRLITF